MMKHILFSLTMLFVMHSLSGQEFVLQKENVNRGTIKSKDSGVYKIKEFNQLLEKFGTEESINDVRCFASTEDYKYWFKWLCARVLPEEIIPFIEKADFGGPYISVIGWRSLPMNCYKGLMIGKPPIKYPYKQRIAIDLLDFYSDSLFVVCFSLEYC